MIPEGAQSAGPSPTSKNGYRRLERGERMPRLDTVFALARGLNVAPADLIAEIE